MSDIAVETASLTIEVPRETLNRLNALAERATGSISDLLADAIAERVEYLEWKLAKIQEAIDELDSGVPSIPHEQVAAWARSLGTPDELLFPQ